MGIPSFYRNITKKFPKCIRQSKDMGGNFKLFFDFNGLIHNVVNDAEQFQLRNNATLFKMIEQYFEYIVDFIKPSFIMVAIDGVCPRAKMVQQRIRRFKSGKERLENTSFDRNCISPGTDWMKDLCMHLSKYFERKYHGKVVFYDASVPGEGEHTIFKYIKNDQEVTDDTRYIVYGLDADLIMLSFIAQKKHIYLLRERQVFEKEFKSDKVIFSFLDIDELKFGLVKYTSFEYDFQINNPQQYLDDFVFFSFLLGNDFIPHINSLSISNNGLDLLIKHYIEMRKKTGNSSLISSKLMKINTNALCAMLKNIVKNENKLVVENSKGIRIRKYDQLNYNHNNWKQNYYYHFFYNDNTSYINKICDNYCRVLNWTFKYYFEGCPSWRFNYHYKTGPCLSDLYAYFLDIDLNKYKFQDDVPYTQNQQLMMILPPKSIDLMPEKYRSLISNELIEFYPVDFKYEVVDKRVEWMHEPKIPEIDDDLMLEYVKD